MCIYIWECTHTHTNRRTYLPVTTVKEKWVHAREREWGGCIEGLEGSKEEKNDIIIWLI